MMKALQALEAIGKCRIVMGDDDEALVRSTTSMQVTTSKVHTVSLNI